MTRARTAAMLLAAAVLGATASGCGGSSGIDSVTGQPGPVTLLDVQTQVFSPRCAQAGCHTGAGAPFGLDLSAGQASGNTVNVSSAEMPSLMRVDPGDPTDSYLYMKLADDPRILGDRMPASGPPLGAADLALIEDWIQQGAM